MTVHLERNMSKLKFSHLRSKYQDINWGLPLTYNQIK